MSRPSLLRRRQFLVGAAAAVVVGCGYGSTTAATRLRLIGEATLAHKLQFKNTTVGGLSALDYDPRTALWYALSDDRSDYAPARCYTLRLDVNANSLGPPQLQDVITLRQANGQPYPNRNQGGELPDPEGLRFIPGSRTLVWSSEGDIGRGLDPFVREVDLSGAQLRQLSLPAHLHASSTPGLGPRNNDTLEGLALSPDGTHLWAAMEGALQQDGAVPTTTDPGGPCRFTQINLATGQPTLQRAYVRDPVPRASIVPGMNADNGVSEILMLDAHRMLVLERSYAAGIGNSIRLYEVDTRSGSNTLAQNTLVPGQYQPMSKTLVANFDTLGLSRLDNTEGMAWGPTLHNGNRTLVFVSDDNFNPTQITQFVAFEYIA